MAARQFGYSYWLSSISMEQNDTDVWETVKEAGMASDLKLV